MAGCRKLLRHFWNLAVKLRTLHWRDYARERLEREAVKPKREVNGRVGTAARTGFVYLKYSRSLRLYKIGKANDAGKRGPDKAKMSSDIVIDTLPLLKAYRDLRLFVQIGYDPDRKIACWASSQAGKVRALDFESDPADEIIAATSLTHDIPLLTRDSRIRKSKLVKLA